MLQYTRNPQLIAPAAATSIALTPSGSIWVSGAYATVLAATSLASVLSGVTLRTTYNADVEFEVDVAVGAPGAEVVIATVKGWSHGQAFSTTVDQLHFTLPIPVDAIPAGARLSARIRHATTNTTTWLVALSYYQKPIVGVMDVSAKPVKVFPSAASMTVLTDSGTAWVNTAFTQIIASTTAALIIEGVIVATHSNTDQREVDIAIGAPGSEVVVYTIRAFEAVLVGGFGYAPLYNPFDGIPQGSRVALRTRGTNGGASILVGFTYREKPL